ncbi:hypothetical protein CBS101457_000079 [Exobasidium rhododendri]|nr:hypothetical protein CBS101457_000079 [Exobasidium rhododendri]
MEKWMIDTNNGGRNSIPTPRLPRKDRGKAVVGQNTGEPSLRDAPATIFRDPYAIEESQRVDVPLEYPQYAYEGVLTAQGSDIGQTSKEVHPFNTDLGPASQAFTGTASHQYYDDPYPFLPDCGGAQAYHAPEVHSLDRPFPVDDTQDKYITHYGYQHHQHARRPPVSLPSRLVDHVDSLPATTFTRPSHFSIHQPFQGGQAVTYDFQDSHSDTEQYNRQMAAYLSRVPQLVAQPDAAWKGYQLKVSPDVSAEHGHDLVYQSLDDDQKLLIVRLIHQVRPYTAAHLRQRLALTLTLDLARMLLSGDEHRVASAVEALYPFHSFKKRNVTAWMRPFTDPQRIQIMEKLAEATGQSIDELRDLFIASSVPSSVASKILHAQTTEEVKAIAEAYNLVVHQHLFSRAWQKGLSQLQRRALLQRMLGCGVQEASYCYDLLRKKKVPRGYGLKMLQADDDEFANIMDWLKGQNTQPL